MLKRNTRTNRQSTCCGSFWNILKSTRQGKIRFSRKKDKRYHRLLTKLTELRKKQIDNRRFVSRLWPIYACKYVCVGHAKWPDMSGRVDM